MADKTAQSAVFPELIRSLDYARDDIERMTGEGEENVREEVQF